ncbi:hypothetical protein [Desulfocurvus sp. DL9XJH121]
MRTYVVDELDAEALERLRKFLETKDMRGVLDDLYWLPLPDALRSPEQAEHADDCGPHVLGLELGEDSVSLELLVRAKGRMRCSCVTYADEAQRAWAMDTLDKMLKELDIPV